MKNLTRIFALFCVLLAGTSFASAATFFWNGPAGSDLNWSDPTNWLPQGLPGLNDSVLFDNTGESGGPGGADNIADSNFTIDSLWYAATNLSPTFSYHNTEIASGVTVTVSNTNTAIVLDAGTQNDPYGSGPNWGLAECYNTIFGSGALTVEDTNSASVVIVSQGSSMYTGKAGLWASLDMSGLNSFNGTFGRLLVGLQGVGATPGQVALNSSGRQSGELALAKTNIIHLTQTGNIQGTGSAAIAGPALVINDCPFFGDYGSDIYLGQSNAFWADTIDVGRQQCSRTAVMEFNSTVVAPAQFFLRGESSNRVSEFVIADNTVNPSTCNAAPGSGIVVPPGGFQVGSAGLFDVSVGTSDIMIDSLIIGKGFAGSGGGYAAGIFNMGAGTLNVNTLQLGVMSATNESAPATGTLNVTDGGSVIVNSGSVDLGVALGSLGGAYATGSLNINNGSINIANGAYGINDDGLSESEVGLTNATVTTANIGSASAPIGSLVIADSTLNLNVNGLQGSVVASSLTTASTLVGITINITSISSDAGAQPAITIIQSESPIAFNGSINTGANGSDLILGSLPAGYQGHLQVNASSVQLILTQTPVSPDKWTGSLIPSHNTNWSAGGNWSGGSEPTATGSAFFVTTGSASASALSHAGGGPSAILSGNINSIVDGNASILDLDYGNTGGTFQNTYISNNDNLTVGAGGLTVGSPVADEGNTTGTTTISGPNGTLNVNNEDAVIYIGLGHSNSASTAEATLDMSGLGTFNADVGSFLVGVGAVGFTSVLQPAGTVYLAQSNTIIANSGNGASDNALVALDVGDAGDAETTAGFGDSSTSSLYLGWTNAIFADYIDTGRQWASGRIAFNPAVISAGPSVYIRGASGNAVTSWNIGDGAANHLANGGGSGTNDFTGGTVDAVVKTLNIGVGSINATASSAVNGTLTFNEGIISANTVNVSDNPNSSGYLSYGVGTLNVDGTGSLVVSGTLNLGFTPGGQGGSAAVSTVNITDGSVWADNVLAGTNGTVSTLTIAGGWLAASNGIATPSAPVTSLNLTNSTIIGAAGAVPFINADNVAAGGSSNTFVILSLPATETYPVTNILLQSSTAIAGSFNFQVELPQGFSGIQLSENPGHTQVILTIQSGPVTARGLVYWVGPNNNNMNWSDSANWFLPPMPAQPDTAFFDSTGQSVVGGGSHADNTVDVNATIAALWYAATNVSADFSPTPSMYHNTVINAGITVTVTNTNAAIVLDAGTQTDPENSTSGGQPVGNASCYNTISGTGALVVDDPNSESVMIVSQGSSTYSYPSAGLWATLDMSGLNTFDGTFGRLLLGIQGVGATPGEVSLNASGRQTGILSLAATNVIHLTQTGNNQGGFAAAAGGPALVVFDSGFSGDNPSLLHLGQSNAIYADTITVGRTGVQSGVMDFNPNFSPPEQLYLRGESSGRVSELIVADSTWEGGNSQYESPDPRIVLVPAITAGGTLNEQESGLIDISAGTVDAMLDTVILGKGYNAGGSGFVVGQLNMGLGTLNVNTLELGAVSAPNTATTVTGILNVTGGTVIANDSLDLGAPMGSSTADFAQGDLNITNGTVEASTFEASGSVNSSITMSGGTLGLTSSAGTIGTLAAPVGSINLSGGTILNLAVGGFPAVVGTSVTGSGTSDTINLTYLPLTVVPSTNTLIKSVSGAIGGYDFVLGSALPSGFKGYLQASADGTAVQLVLTNSPSFPTKGVTITSAKVQNGDITLSGTNGVPGDFYYVLSSTNLAAPLATRWTIISTNAFDSSGDFNDSFPTSNGQQYFRIESQ